jgi:hypothetical protein
MAVLLIGFAGDRRVQEPEITPTIAVPRDEGGDGGKAVEVAPPKPPGDPDLAHTGPARSIVLTGWGLALAATGLALIDLTAPTPARAVRRSLPRRTPPPRRRGRASPVTGMWLSRTR